jgi:hypothetical protein
VKNFLPRVKCGLRPPPLVAGPVRSSLRCGRPARRRRMTKGPMTENGSPQAIGPRALWSCCCGASGPAFSGADPRHGRPPAVKAADASLRDHAAREPGPMAPARKDWPLRRQALGMILRVLRWGDQRQIRMLRSDLSRARRREQRMSQLVSAVRLG